MLKDVKFEFFRTRVRLIKTDRKPIVQIWSNRALSAASMLPEICFQIHTCHVN